MRSRGEAGMVANSALYLFLSKRRVKLVRKMFDD